MTKVAVMTSMGALELKPESALSADRADDRNMMNVTPGTANRVDSRIR